MPDDDPTAKAQRLIYKNLEKLQKYITPINTDT